MKTQKPVDRTVMPREPRAATVTASERMLINAGTSKFHKAKSLFLIGPVTSTSSHSVPGPGTRCRAIRQLPNAGCTPLWRS